MFILIMQFLWKYIDDLMGKGLNSFVILELLFYVSASLIPLALPLAVLLSSIMTLGNLAENNELTALKASGLSLYRIMRPLTFIVLIIAALTFSFANYVIPVANFKWHSLIYDIQNTKISSLLTPGVYSNELDGYAIKVEQGNDKSFKGILIHDHTHPDQIKTIRAEKGKIYKSENGKYLFFELKNGFVTEELSIQSPTFNPNGMVHTSDMNNRPSRRSSFEQATYKIELAGFSLKRSQAETFGDKHEMLNVFQIYSQLDSVQQLGGVTLLNFMQSLKNDHSYFQSLYFKADTLNQGVPMPKDSLSKTAIVFDSIPLAEKQAAISEAQTKLRQRKENLNAQYAYLQGIQKDIDGYWIEFHRKFALTYAIIVLFFIGAPLGAIVRKGGFGAPVVIAALLFMIYFVLNSIGNSLALSQVVSPFFGMWFASILLTPIAFLLMRAAANDSPVFDKDAWRRFSNRFNKKNARSTPKS